MIGERWGGGAALFPKFGSVDLTRWLFTLLKGTSKQLLIIKNFSLIDFIEHELNLSNICTSN
jgi:hypothetical protein